MNTLFQTSSTAADDSRHVETMRFWSLSVCSVNFAQRPWWLLGDRQGRFSVTLHWVTGWWCHATHERIPLLPYTFTIACLTRGSRSWRPAICIPVTTHREQDRLPYWRRHQPWFRHVVNAFIREQGISRRPLLTLALLYISGMNLRQTSHNGTWDSEKNRHTPGEYIIMNLVRRMSNKSDKSYFHCTSQTIS